MSDRIVTYILKNSDIVSRPLPSVLLKGEPIINTAEGIMYFSGSSQSVPSWTQAGTGSTSTFFEVGSNLYDLQLRNKITKYNGLSGSNLIGKFLSGTTNGFVLADISSIAGVDTYVTGGTYDNSSGTASFKNNFGNNFNVSGFFTGNTEIYVTGGTANSVNGTAIFTNNTGGTFTVTGLSTGTTDTYISGGTANSVNGTAIFTNNTGGTFTVTGLTKEQHIGTGVLTFLGATISGPTTINVGAASGYIVDDETNPGDPIYISVNYLGQTNVVVPTISSGIISYLFLQSDGSLFFQNNPPSSADRKKYIYLCKIAHQNLTTLSLIGNEVDYITSPLQQHRDLFRAFGYINQGIYVTSNGSNLKINSSTGSIIGNGVNFVNDNTNPNESYWSGGTNQQFLYRGITGGTSGYVTNLDPTKYDDGFGNLVSVGGSVDSSTNQYVFFVPSTSNAGGFIIQYGQKVYSNLSSAVAGVGKEIFNIYPVLSRNAILVGVISMTRVVTSLNDATGALFFRANKLGEVIGATAGTSISNLQDTYNNSTAPQITTSISNGALNIRRGSALDTDEVFSIENGNGDNVSGINGNGEIFGSKLIKSGGLSSEYLMADGSVSVKPFDVFVTGGTYSTGTTTFSNNTGGTFSVSGYLTGTTDTYVTGFTYNPSNNNFTISQNGVTDKSVSLNTVSGLTISDLGPNRLVYTNGSNKLISSTTATFDGTNMVLPSNGSLNLGNLVVNGDLTIFGGAISAFTSQLYVEDNNISLNYNPTGSTSSASIGAGLTIQDGNGITNGNVNFDIRQMNTFTGLTSNNIPSIIEYSGPTGFNNRAWVTQLNDIVIRSTNPSTPNGIRLLGEFDILDGGQY